MLLFISATRFLSPFWHCDLVNVVEIIMLLVLFKHIWDMNAATVRCTSVCVCCQSVGSCSPVCIGFLSSFRQVLVITEHFRFSSISVNHWSC